MRVFGPPKIESSSSGNYRSTPGWSDREGRISGERSGERSRERSVARGLWDLPSEGSSELGSNTTGVEMNVEVERDLERGSMEGENVETINKPVETTQSASKPEIGEKVGERAAV
jgi:hypothetical protein